MKKKAKVDWKKVHKDCRKWYLKLYFQNGYFPTLPKVLYKVESLVERHLFYKAKRVRK